MVSLVSPKRPQQSSTCTRPLPKHQPPPPNSPESDAQMRLDWNEFIARWTCCSEEHSIVLARWGCVEGVEWSCLGIGTSPHHNYFLSFVEYCTWITPRVRSGRARWISSYEQPSSFILSIVSFSSSCHGTRFLLLILPISSSYATTLYSPVLDCIDTPQSALFSKTEDN